jgi:alpha-glucosidase
VGEPAPSLLGRRALLVGTSATAVVSVLAEASAAITRPDGVEIRAGVGWLRVTALSDAILRIQAAPGPEAPPSDPWAVLPEWRERSVPVQPLAGEAAGFSTHSLRVVIDRAPLRLSISDTAGRVLVRDAPGRPTVFYSDGGFELCLESPPGTQYLGLGDKPGALGRRGRAFGNWNTDAYAWQESTDPLYKTVPFFFALREGAAHGVFLDTTWRSHFDFGVARRDAISFGAEGGALEWYLVAGPHPKQVLERYTALTGRMPLPPLWSLGFHQSRWSYPTAARVREVVRAYRAAGIPLDAIWLDIDYEEKHRPFTVNRTAFPDLPGLVRELAAQGVRVVTIVDPHIALLPGNGYAPYDSGMAGDRFVRAANGSVFVGRVWPGPSVFPDFADPAVRAWWGSLFGPLWVEAGVAGIWNDMNEPSVFDGPGKTMPLDARHRIAPPDAPPREAVHREVHNAYGMLNAQATAEGLRRLTPDRRPFVLTRATFAGGQRSAAIWTGDNSATWNHLRLSVPQLLNLGLSGFPLVGADVGGFRGTPSPALLTRWIEVAAFTPFFRDHTEKGSADQEAYVGDAAEVAARRRAIAERYRLMPYLYTLAEEAARTGVPIMRPLLLEFPEFGTGGPDSQFLFGPALLIAPPPDESEDDYLLVLPPGSDWFDYWTGHALGKEAPLLLSPNIHPLPVFARAGSILPRQPLVQSTAERPQGALELLVYPGPEASGTVYWDDGITLAHTRGVFLRQAFTARPGSEGLHLALSAQDGTYRPWWQAINIAVFGQDKPPSAVLADGQPVAFAFDPAARAVRFSLPAAPSGTSVLLAA